MQALLDEFRAQVDVSSAMEAVVGAFLVDMAEKDSTRRSIRMLETFVEQLPTGRNESGIYYALDLGGTFFRVTKFEFTPNQDPEHGAAAVVAVLAERAFKIPNEMKHAASADILFDYLAECVCTIAPAGENIQIGFTFSFPTKQTGLNQGSLIQWTKGWTTAGVEGEEVVQLLVNSLNKVRHAKDVVVQVSGADVPLKLHVSEIKCLLNDTVGTLAAGRRMDAAVSIGVILGTGTNAAFQDANGRVINTEWGSFSSPFLPHTEVDLQVDATSVNPGQQRFEKLISGFYLCEIVKRAVMREGWPFVLQPGFEWDSSILSTAEADTSLHLNQVGAILAAFGKLDSTGKERIWFKEICEAVCERAARLTACAITALVRRISEPGEQQQQHVVKVAVDGALFEHHVSFRSRLERALKILLCPCELLLVKDGSSLGAALIAAVH